MADICYPRSGAPRAQLRFDMLEGLTATITDGPDFGKRVQIAGVRNVRIECGTEEIVTLVVEVIDFDSPLGDHLRSALGGAEGG